MSSCLEMDYYSMLSAMSWWERRFVRWGLHDDIVEGVQIRPQKAAVGAHPGASTKLERVEVEARVL